MSNVNTGEITDISLAEHFAGKPCRIEWMPRPEGARSDLAGASTLGSPPVIVIFEPAVGDPAATVRHEALHIRLADISWQISAEEAVQIGEEAARVYADLGPDQSAELAGYDAFGGGFGGLNARNEEAVILLAERWIESGQRPPVSGLLETVLRDLADPASREKPKAARVGLMLAGGLAAVLGVLLGASVALSQPAFHYDSGPEACRPSGAAGYPRIRLESASGAVWLNWDCSPRPAGCLAADADAEFSATPGPAVADFNALKLSFNRSYQPGLPSCAQAVAQCAGGGSVVHQYKAGDPARSVWTPQHGQWAAQEWASTVRIICP